MPDSPTRRLALLGAVLILGIGCGDARPTEPAGSDPDFAKGSGGGGGVTVTAADPSFSKQGTLALTVRVLGSGFDQGSRASWERDGAPDPKIKVNATTFVSTSELRANIDIAADAVIDLYDIAVYTSGGRKGVGTEKFSVTSAVPLGVTGETSDALGVNALGRIVGRYCNNAGCNTGEGAFVWDPGAGAQVVDPSAAAFGIDNAGGTIVGRDGGDPAAGRPVVWTGSLGAWAVDTLPGIGGNGAAWAVASDAAGLAKFVAGWVQAPTGGRLPTRWSWNGAEWVREVFTLPSGPSGLLLRDVNALGMSVGFDGTGCCWAAYYDQNGNGETLPRINNAASTAWDITEDGLRIAGGSNSRAVVWSRASVEDDWTLPIVLEDTRAYCGRSGSSVAFGINETGMVVGMSCEEAVAWKPSASGYQRVRLGSLGVCNKGECHARRVNNAGTVVGEANGDAVYWFGF
jgi:hypothetical protein